jgi:hypothetical protein
MSEEDMRALYVYLMQAVKPVTLPNRPLEMSFPFNQRWGMALRNMAFLQRSAFEPDPALGTVESRCLHRPGTGALRGLSYTAASHAGKDHE